MAKSEPLFVVNLGDNGGTFEARTFQQFVDWTNDERDKWKWLLNVEDGPMDINVRTHFQNQLDLLAEYARGLKERGTIEGEDPVGTMEARYNSTLPALIHSESKLGQAIFAMRKSLGEKTAILAYALLTGHLAVELRNPLHSQALFLASNPESLDAAAVKAVTQEILDKAVTKARQAAGEQSKLLENSRQSTRRMTGEAERNARRALRRFLKTGVRAGNVLGRRADKSISAIEATNEAFTEQMKLKASVGYWDEKKATHGTARSSAFSHLTIFAIVAAVILFATFWIAIAFMLEASGVDASRFFSINPEGTKKIAFSAYVVVTGAVGTILTSFFWVARVLLRNYLTERRLETDADERKIMTMTYLALIKDGAALGEDRLIILNALFRPSPDSPTGDDGSNDIALPAIIAKLMDQRALK